MGVYSNTILLVHPSSLEPSTFVTRLLDRPVSDEDSIIKWTIDNKYYTAEVSIQLLELDHDGSLPAGVDVLVYLFERIPTTLPPGLIKNLVDDPKDIALAIRIKSEDEFDTVKLGEDEEWKDIFEEVGLEVIDENAQAEEDDERPTSPLETIRQTLMTHLWPSMVRKPQNGITSTLPQTGYAMDDDLAEVEEEEELQNQAGPSTFPISFEPSAQIPDSRQVGLEPVKDEAFPNLAELKAQIEMDDFERFGSGAEGGGMDRLAMLDDMFGAPGQDEYARLDEWLDQDDEDECIAALEDEPSDEQGSGNVEWTEEVDANHRSGTARPEARLDTSDETFDDDFDDFAAFQSAPPKATITGTGQHVTADPTPLLMHLQTVRAELAGLSEEERRLRAGKEVARVMRDLGFDDIDASDLLAEDEDLNPGL